VRLSVKVGDLVKFSENGKYRAGIIVMTWRTHRRRIHSVDIMTEDRIVPRLFSAVEVISESR